MTKHEFLKIISSIKPDKHIIAGRRGSEENVKIKIVLPLLQFLGYNIIEDLDFERLSADVVIVDEKLRPILIIETKAWEAQIKNYLDQCLEYTFKLRTPFIMITSGQHTALYSSLVNLDNLSEAKPIIEFNLKDLLNKNGRDILSELSSLISKDSLLNNANELNKAVVALLSEDRSINEAKREFTGKCTKFKSKIKAIKINDDDFVELANSHPKEIYNALILAKDELYKIAKENKNIRVRYRSKTMGLEYLYDASPRPRLIGLVEIHPTDARISFGIQGWNELTSSSGITRRMIDFAKSVKNEKQIRNLISLLHSAIKKIKV